MDSIRGKHGRNHYVTVGHRNNVTGQNALAVSTKERSLSIIAIVSHFPITNL